MVSLQKIKNMHPDVLYISGIILLMLVFLIPLFQPLFYVSHDGDAHVARFAAYFQAFVDGQFPARWAGNLNYGYGTPLFIFYYPLPGYIASFMHVLGISYEIIFKILIIAAFIAAPAFFYVWSKLLFKKEIAFIGALFYGLAPYHFLDLYVRADVAELMALAFVPLVFWSIEKVLTSEKQYLKYAALGGIFYAICILSHNGISLMFSPVFALYGLLRVRQIRSYYKVIVTLSIGLFAAAFFWIPALYESRFTNIHLFVGDMFRDHFAKIEQLVYSNWGFGPDVSKPGGLSPQIGVLYVLLALASIVVAMKNITQRKMISGWLFVFFAAAFITLPYSAFIWEQVPLLRVYEFPWRFTALSSFAAVVLVCYVLASLTNKKITAAIIIVLLLSSIPLVKIDKYITHPDSFYEKFPGTTYYHGEASPIWTAGDPSAYAKEQIAFIENKGIISDYVKKSHMHTFRIDASQGAKLVDNTTYFPGWKVKVDGKGVPIEFQDQNYRGLITFKVPVGKHTVEVLFTESKDRILANILSLLGIIIIITLFIANRFSKPTKISKK